MHFARLPAARVPFFKPARPSNQHAASSLTSRTANMPGPQTRTPWRVQSGLHGRVRSLSGK